MASFRSRCAAARCATAIFISYTSSLAAAQAAEQNENGAKPQASEEVVVTGHYDNGPYFASKGDFASAGAADIHYAKSLPKSMVELGGGSFLYGRILLAGSLDLGGGKLLHGFELFHDDGPWDHPDDYRRLNGVLRYSRQTGDATWGLTAMGYYGLWNATDQIPLRGVASGQIDRFGTIDPTTGG